MSGPYTSSETYAVSYSDTGDVIRFTLTLTPLAQPFTGRYAHIDTGEVARYNAMLAQGFSFGAYDGQVLVGLLIAERESWNNSLSVREFHVAADYRGQGLGRRLMEACAAQARAAGLRIITCETQNQNVNAIKAYRALGFRPEAVDLSLYSNTDYPDRGIAVWMKRRLDDNL